MVQPFSLILICLVVLALLVLHKYFRNYHVTIVHRITDAKANLFHRDAPLTIQMELKLFVVTVI